MIRTDIWFIELFRELYVKPIPKNIDNILGYKAIRNKGVLKFLPVKIDRNIEHKRYPAWLFIRNLKRKINLNIENCCDPFNRILGFLYKGVYYYTPLTLINEYKYKYMIRNKNGKEN